MSDLRSVDRSELVESYEVEAPPRSQRGTVDKVRRTDQGD
jgi:hypothetical protein